MNISSFSLPRRIDISKPKYQLSELLAFLVHALEEGQKEEILMKSPSKVEELPQENDQLTKTTYFRNQS
jgi:hypothetical protein